MFWKLIIKVLKCTKKPYIRAIKEREGVYIINIYKFVLADDELKEWKDALGKYDKKQEVGRMNVESLKEYEKIKKETALEIIDIFKSRNLTVALMDDVLEHTKQVIHNNAHL